MQVSVEATGALERRMTVEVPEEIVLKEVQNRLQKLARTAKVKGFRPGKVPMKVLTQQYGEQVRQEVLGEVMKSSFYQAVTKEQLRPVGLPQIEPKAMESGRNLEYTATFEVFPEVKLASLEGVALERPVAEVNDADVDKMLDTLRKQRTQWENVERAAKEGDRVVIDFEGTINGEAFAGNKGQNVPVTLGGKRMIPGFEEGLIGAAPGEERKLDLTFPQDYPYKEVAGKPVQFDVKVNSVQEARLPELDEAFSKSLGIAEGGIEALRREVRENMERELNQNLKNRTKQAVLDKLLELNQLEIPKTLVENEAHGLAEQLRQQMHVPAGKQGPALDASMFEEQARRRVALGLILSEIIQSKGLKAEPAKVRETVENLAASYEHPEQVVKWYYEDRRRLADVESLVLEETVVEWALGQARVNEVKRSFDEVMNKAESA